MDEMIMEGSLLREIKKLIITTTTTEKQISLEPHLAFCYSIFMKDIQTIVLGKTSQISSIPFGIESQYSKMIFGIKQYLGLDEHLDVVCVLWCVLRALDTVEDDTNIPSELKVSILEDFHRHIYDRDLPISCGTKRHKVLMDEYHHVSSALLELQKGYQISIEKIVKIMGVGMAKYILNEVETVDDYNEYCFKAVGIVFLEMSKHLHASNLEDPTSDHSHSLGTMIQKLHIIEDFFDDMNEIPKGRIYWPRQIWSKYVDKLDDLIHPEEPEKALWCLNDMVTDALSHAADSLEYLSTLPHFGTFNVYAIIQVIAVGTLSLCYNNIEVFRGGARMSPGQCAKVVLGIKTMSGVYEAIYDFLSTLKTKIDSNDPNATKTLRCVKEIQKICGNSGLLNQSNSSLDAEVDGKRCQVRQGGNSSMEEQQVDPFSLVADELSLIGKRLREMVVSVEAPKLASAAGYFFEIGVEGKRFRPTILLLMASALNVSVLPGSQPDTVTNFSNELRTRQQRIAEITEMIHVASLLHDDVLDDAETRRGVQSLNFSMGNKLSVLAGDFLLSRACVTLSSLNNLEVISLISEVIEHLVTGETMQMSSTLEQRCDMDHYMRKTYYKTASLIANSCRTIAILAGQTSEAEILAYNYGKHLGLAYQLIDDVLDFTGTSTSLGKGSLSDIRHGIITAPILFAIEEYPELQKVINRGFNDPRDVDLSLEYLGKSLGIQRAIELATEHANLAASAINSLPQSGDDKVGISRRALVDLTHIIITRTN
ncbi:hypothetical protein C5167_000190 [Papaver somniferum]|uniref:Squalene synthase n=1 Tax=Papaver somniferum TaxID=3469 RepID=A0A4Y7KSM3_PAPSO|nr:solanesyl diphosphate synthase 1-like [Papaver somniferum]RZC75807.1 hypothetical protein C5167_000190 [Papaver somniferum]